MLVITYDHFPLVDNMALSQRRIYRPPTPLHPSAPIRSGHIYVKYGKNAESNEKSYIRLLVFELLVAKELPIGLQKNWFKSGQIYKEDWDWSDNDFSQQMIFFVRLLVFEIWSILYFPFSNAFRTWQKFEEKKILLGLMTLAWTGQRLCQEGVVQRRDVLIL